MISCFWPWFPTIWEWFVMSSQEKKHCAKNRIDHGRPCGTEFILVSLYSTEITQYHLWFLECKLTQIDFVPQGHTWWILYILTSQGSFCRCKRDCNGRNTNVFIITSGVSITANILSTHIPISCQPALSFLTYVYFKIWLWKSKVKVMGVVKVWDKIVGPASNQFIFFLFYISMR